MRWSIEVRERPLSGGMVIGSPAVQPAAQALGHLMLPCRPVNDRLSSLPGIPSWENEAACWGEMGRLLMTSQGFQFRLGLEDRTDEA